MEGGMLIIFEIGNPWCVLKIEYLHYLFEYEGVFKKMPTADTDVKILFRHENNPPAKNLKCYCNKKITTKSLICCGCRSFFHQNCSSLSSEIYLQIYDLVEAGVNLYWLCHNCDKLQKKEDTLTNISYSVAKIAEALSTNNSTTQNSLENKSHDNYATALLSKSPEPCMPSIL